MSKEIIMPKMGMTMEEGTIDTWLVKEGETVKKGDVLFVASTDKLTNDIQAEADGTILRILVPEGETVPVFSVIAYMGEAGESVPVGDGVNETTVEEKTSEPIQREVTVAEAPKGEAACKENVIASPAAKKLASERGVDLAEVTASSVSGRIRMEDVDAYYRTPGLVAKRNGERVIATPAAKKLAKERGVDITHVIGFGPEGRIRERDVEAFIANFPADVRGVKVSPVAAKMAAELGVDLKKIQKNSRIMKADVKNAAGVLDVPPVAEVVTPPTATAVEIPNEESNDMPPVKVDALRKSIAKNMTESWHTSPRVTYTRPVDATAMKELRAKLKPHMDKKGIKITYNHIIMKVCARALMEMPDVNASFANNMLTRHKHANVGLAVAKGDGLIVPNVKKCDIKSISEVAEETERLIAQVREGNFDLADITGGTFTISSLGPFGITNFSPIINQPELAILGVCDMVDTPVVRNGEVVIRPMMNLCLTADHRVVDGVKASKFLMRIAELLENPFLMLA